MYKDSATNLKIFLTCKLLKLLAELTFIVVKEFR